MPDPKTFKTRNGIVGGVLALITVLIVVLTGWKGLLVELALLLFLLIGTAFYLEYFVLNANAKGGLKKILGLGQKDDPVHDSVKVPVERIEKESEIWEMTTADGLHLKARFLKQKQETHRYMIICHGYCNHRLQDVSRQALDFYARGVHVFLPYARGHGLSEGDHIGMGWEERKDIVSWIHRILQYDEKAEIGLFGVSMGGATVMMTAGETLPENVRFVIEDCGYTSVYDEFLEEIKVGMGLPPYPLIWICDAIHFLKYGYGYKKASSVNQLKKAKVPILMIHGEEDRFVPYEMLQTIYDSYAGIKRRESFPEAAHVGSFRKAPERYWALMEEWMNQWFQRE